MTILGTRLIPDIFWAGSEDEAGQRVCESVRKRKGERKDDGGKGGWWYTLQLYNWQRQRVEHTNCHMICWHTWNVVVPSPKLSWVGDQ